MNVEIENVSQVEKRLSFVVPAEEVDKTLSDIFRELKKEAKLKGFRKGKAPEGVVRAHFRDYAFQEAEKQIISGHYKEALEDKKLAVISEPDIQMDGIEEGKDFQFQAIVEVHPELPEINGYKGVPVKSKLVVSYRKPAWVYYIQVVKVKFTVIKKPKVIKTGAAEKSIGIIFIISPTGRNLLSPDIIDQQTIKATADFNFYFHLPADKVAQQRVNGETALQSPIPVEIILALGT